MSRQKARQGNIQLITIHFLASRQRHYSHRDSETVIANPQVIPLSERRLTDPTKWNHYTPEIRNGKEINSATNVDYLDYMDMIIMDANKVSLPRARLDSGEKTV